MTTPERTPRSPAELFLAFNRLALQGFGGVLAVAQIELVERRGWLSREEFVELLSASQVLPGPNVVNLALMLGDRWFGWRGALAALGGLIVVPLAIVMALTLAYDRYSAVPQVAGALRGMGAVAAGLVLVTALKLMGTLRGNRLGPWLSAAVAAATFGAIALARWPLAAVIATLGPLACLLAAWRLRR
jgi:chromate transporter